MSSFERNLNNSDDTQLVSCNLCWLENVHSQNKKTQKAGRSNNDKEKQDQTPF